MPADFTNATPSISAENKEKLLWLLAAATFVIFFQAYMIAPLIPSLSSIFKVSRQFIGILVPAYLIPYALSTLFYGLLADRFRPTSIIILSLLTFVVLTLATSTATSVNELILWRFLTGMGSSGVIPIAVALTGRLYRFAQRGLTKEKKHLFTPLCGLPERGVTGEASSG